MNTSLTSRGKNKASSALLRLILVLLFSFSSLVFLPFPAHAASVLTTISFGSSRANALVANPATNRIYAAAEDVPGINVIDGATNTIVTTVPTQGFHTGITLNSVTNKVYMSQQFSGSVRVIDGAANTVETDIPISGQPGNLAVNTVLNRLYVIRNHSEVVVIDTTTNTQIATFNPGQQFSVDVGIDKNANRIYVVDQFGSTVGVFDGATHTFLTNILVGSSPFAVSVNATTHHIFTSNNGENTVSVIDGGTNTVVATVSTGTSPLGIAVNDITNRVYVGNNASDDVTIIDGATNTVVETVAIGFHAPFITANSATNWVYVGTDSGHVVVVIQDTPPTTQQFTALSPAKIWVGLKNSDDVGVRFDLLAEVFKDNTLISSGQLSSVPGGSSGFNNAKLHTISFTPFSPVDFPSGAQLKIKLSVRNTCTSPTHNSGTARLWFNDSAANSQFGATIGTATTDYFLRDGFTLTSTVGTGPKKTIDVQAGAPCSAFKSFGTWTITL